jgi:hypothetical protein
VRLEEVEEEEERLLLVLFDPLLGDGGRGVSRALQRAGRGAGAVRDRVVVEVEGAGHPGVAAQHVGRDCAAGCIPGGPQQGGDGRRLGAQAIADVAADAVARREEAGEDGSVRGEREGDVRVGVGEEDRVAAERVEVRRLDFVVAVHRQAIGAQGVDGDEDHRSALADICDGVLDFAGKETEEREREREEPEAGHVWARW